MSLPSRSGEITTKAKLDIPAIVRQTVNEIGYNDAKTGFDGNTCAVMVALDQQSPEITLTSTPSRWKKSSVSLVFSRMVSSRTTP